MTKGNFAFNLQTFGIAIKMYAMIQYWEGFEKNDTFFGTNSRSSLTPPLMADIEIPGGLLGLRLCKPLGTFVCIDGKYCEKDALVG